MLRVLGDDHCKRMFRITVGVARLRALTAQWQAPSVHVGQKDWVEELFHLVPIPWFVNSFLKYKSSSFFGNVHVN